LSDNLVPVSDVGCLRAGSYDPATVATTSGEDVVTSCGYLHTRRARRVAALN